MVVAALMTKCYPLGRKRKIENAQLKLSTAGFKNDRARFFST
jgi:hypothetical protein